jgi:adenylate kinase family enzyme
MAASTSLVSVSVGQLLRSRVASGGMHADSIRAAMMQGLLVSDAIVFSLLKDTIHSSLASDQVAAAAPLVFLVDGFPRTLRQAVAMPVELNCVASQIVFIDCPEEVQHHPLTSGSTIIPLPRIRSD